MKRLLSYYQLKLPIHLTYMLQQVEYQPANFISWFLRLPNLNKVMYRKDLVWTPKTKLLVTNIYFLLIVQALEIFLVGYYISLVYAFILLVASPFMVVATVYFLVSVVWVVIEAPRRNQQIAKSKEIFSKHQGIKIAILGSYGKTTMKELLFEVMSEGRKTVSTPGNMNVSISHARFAAKLGGDEEVVLIEYGEATLGDIARFAENTYPDVAIITGLAPNHLDKYKSLENVASDLLSIDKYVKPEHIYINKNIGDLAGENLEKFNKYDENGLPGISIKDVHVSLEGMKFTAKFDNGESIILETALTGRHLLGPLAVCILLSKKAGLSLEQIKTAISKTKPYEHRLKPRKMSGAWILDDTYNGSLEGFRAGLRLLKDVKAKRKIYVTPGLVDQGQETVKVHQEIGKLIAECNPDKVVLMKNSVTEIIKGSLIKNKYSGEVEVRDDPLEFYTNLEHAIAAGDVILLQNDWTDNYN